MENKDISQIALQKIKESGIKPISKNFFNLKRVLFWSIVGISLVFGAISFSILISILFNNDWYLYNRFGFGFILRSLPYFWFVFLIIFTILGDYYYRKTYLGYRRKTITIIFIYITLTVISGSVLSVVGIGESIENSLSRNISVYQGFMFDKNEFWAHPENGLLFGRIIEIDNDLIKVIDQNGVIWIININEASVGRRAEIKVGEIIKIIGDKDFDDIFMANEIRPWIGNGHRQNFKFNYMMR